MHPTRDFNFVEDTVRGFIAAINRSEAYGEVINIGSNFEISIKDTVNLIASLMDISVEIVTENQRLRPQKSEVERLWASNQKAKKLLDWEPNFQGLDGLKQGLTQTISWFTKPENLAAYKTGHYTI